MSGTFRPVIPAPFGGFDGAGQEVFRSGRVLSGPRLDLSRSGQEVSDPRISLDLREDPGENLRGRVAVEPPDPGILVPEHDGRRVFVPPISTPRYFFLKHESWAKTKVSLTWKTKNSDYPMQPYHLSDGSIRFICLATALLQPNPPSTIIIDEPELGLHPEAIRILGELIEDAAKRTQIIVATQSPLLLDQFAIEDVIVVNRKEGRSTFERLNPKDFNEWLEDYSVGELWTKNVIKGGTTNE